MEFEPAAAGILGGEKSLAAYLAFQGVESLEELEPKQLCLFPERSRDEEHGECPPSARAA